MSDTPPCTPLPHTGSLILAGGLSRRMGQHKTEVKLGEKTLLEHSIGNLKSVGTPLVISCNHGLPRFNEITAVITDEQPGYRGPLMGIVSAMHWFQQHTPAIAWLAVASVDTPFLTREVYQYLWRHMQPNTTILCPTIGSTSHPLCGLWAMSQAERLHQAIYQQQQAKVLSWLEQEHTQYIDCQSLIDDNIDRFKNINTPQDLVEAEKQWHKLKPDD